MALEKITSITGPAVYVPGNDIDTDRIIPARFMKCIVFDGLGEFLFYDVRKNADGTDRPHPLNEARFKRATILLSGANFGCGSSREHAPQAIQKYGELHDPRPPLRDGEPRGHRKDRGGRGTGADDGRRDRRGEAGGPLRRANGEGGGACLGARRVDPRSVGSDRRAD